MDEETLTDRFRRFCRELPGAEWIDDLNSADEREGKHRADVFFADRMIVAEMKTITADQEPKLKALLAGLAADERWPVFVGQWPIGEIQKHIPIPEEVVTTSLKILGRAAENWVRGANRHIRDTKAYFTLPGAKGLLVILNDGVAMWSADTIAKAVGYELTKRKADGTPRFDQIAGVWIADEAHYLVRNRQRLYPNVEIPNPAVPGHDDVMSFLGQIREAWAACAGTCDAGEIQGVDLSNLENADGELADSPLPIHKAWTAEYRATPYLRAVAEASLLSMMALLLLELRNRLRVGGDLPPRYQRHISDVLAHLRGPVGHVGTSLSGVATAGLLRRWFHCLEETRQRGINLRALEAYLPQA
jgi:hypothetical protein